MKMQLQCSRCRQEKKDGFLLLTLPDVCFSKNNNESIDMGNKMKATAEKGKDFFLLSC